MKDIAAKLHMIRDQYGEETIDRIIAYLESDAIDTLIRLPNNLYLHAMVDEGRLTLSINNCI